jgi:glycerol-3-phosphate dehydrogenase
MLTEAALSSQDRDATLDRLETTVFDCLVIGGGITGAGIAREATLRGLSVALVESEDFAAGTSGRSSKLIHGGLRYLAQGDVALVRETALERKRVHRLAPHLAEPSWMLVPARSRAGLLKFRAGLGTYETLGAVAEADRHRNWDSDALAEGEPLLRRDRTPFACLYREYLTEDARLVLANLRDARRRGAEIVNHAKVETICIESRQAAGVEVRCALSGRQLRVNARSIVNAAGPWVEAVRRLEDPAAPSLLHLSKGVHVVLPAKRLPVRQIVILGAADKRSLFVIPRGDIVYIGTTDTSYTGPTHVWPVITREDVEYLLEPIPRSFDVPPIRPEECVAAWSGLRPLIAQAGKPPTEISRRDEIWIGPSRVITIAGGKLTGYRKMAVSAVDRVAQVLGKRLREAPDDEPLPGGDFAGDLVSLSAALRQAFELDELSAARLARLYGSEAGAVLAAGAEPILPGGRVRAGEIDWALAQEGAATVSDVIYRRTRAALYDPCERHGLVLPVAEYMATRLGWSAERMRFEIAATNACLAQELCFRAEAAA